MPAKTSPPGPRTGYSHPECYARTLKDCDTRLTREHFISRKLLESIDAPLAVAGTSWATEPTLIGPNALASKVLCARHNEALSSLDDNVSGLYTAVRDWQLDRAVGHVAFDGEDIERWALKAMLGFMTSGNARHPSGDGRLVVTSVPESYLRLLFGEGPWPPGAGMYLLDETVPSRLVGGVSITLAAAEGGEYAGKTLGPVITFAGLSFLVSIAAEVSSLTSHRPRELELDGGGVIEFHWPLPHTLATSGGAFVVKRQNE